MALISRHWKGVARRDRAEAYVRHLLDDTFPHLRGIPGFVRASILRREVEEGTEFQIVSLWESLDAIRAFAGDDLEKAHIAPEARALLSRWEERVTHFERAFEDVN